MGGWENAIWIRLGCVVEIISQNLRLLRINQEQCWKRKKKYSQNLLACGWFWDAYSSNFLAWHDGTLTHSAGCSQYAKLSSPSLVFVRCNFIWHSVLCKYNNNKYNNLCLEDQTGVIKSPKPYLGNQMQTCDMQFLHQYWALLLYIWFHSYDVSS